MPELRNPPTPSTKDIELTKLPDNRYEVKLILPLIDLKKVRDGLVKNIGSVFFPKDLKPFCSKLLPLLQKELPK